jgi:hypothetical protein
MPRHERAANATLAVVVLVLLLGITLAALAALPRLSSEERLVARALGVLAERRQVRTSVTLRAGAVRASCRVVSRTDEVVTFGGRRFALSGRQPVDATGLPLRDSLRRDAFLAGCPRLLVTSVGRRLRGGRPVYGGRTTVQGRPAHVLLAGSSGEIELLVAQSSLEPLAVRFGRNVTAYYVP